MPDRYAVIGNPVAHSKSPRIHAEFARETGERMSYEKLHAELPDFEAVVRKFREDGGRGLNVTVPFKHRAHDLAPKRSDRAAAAGAVNTLKFDGPEVFGDNTDGIGLVRDLRDNLGCEIAGRRILLLGAGGASYGVCAPLLDERPATFVIANRTHEKAVALAQRFATLYAGADVVGVGYGALQGRTFDVVVNATSAGLSGEMPPIGSDVFARGALAYDMVYGKPTPFLELATRAGVRTADGLGMLVEQAAESFHLWRGVKPQTAPVIALLRSDAGA